MNYKGVLLLPVIGNIPSMLHQPRFQSLMPNRYTYVLQIAHLHVVAVCWLLLHVVDSRQICNCQGMYSHQQALFL